MASKALSELIVATRENFMGLGNDLLFRKGDSIDPRNADDPPTSISITRQLNKAFYDLLIATKFNVEDVAISLSVGTREYALDSSWLDVLSVWYSGTNYRLRKTTTDSLDKQAPKWRSVGNGIPQRFYINSTSKIGLDVPPSAAVSLNLSVVKSFTPLNVLSDTIANFPEPFSYLACLRAAWYCCVADFANPAAQNRAKELDTAYQDQLSIFKEFINNRFSADEDSPVILPKGVQG